MTLILAASTTASARTRSLDMSLFIVASYFWLAVGSESTYTVDTMQLVMDSERERKVLSPYQLGYGRRLGRRL